MASKNKKFELRKIIEIETIIAAILISVASWGVSKWYDFETAENRTRQMVFSQYSTAQNLVLDSIETCLSQKKIDKKSYNQRTKNRHNLVRVTIENAKIIPANAFFSISKFTRLDYTQSLQDLCSLDKAELIQLRNSVYRLQGNLWKELNLRPS